MSLDGRWRIVEIERWDKEAIDLIGPGFTSFASADDTTGEFGFVAVQGWMDCEYGERFGRPHVEFTWDGGDDGDQVNGRGWAALEEDGSLHGRIYFHQGEASDFRAVRDATRTD